MSSFNISVAMLRLQIQEIQDCEIENIAKHSLTKAIKKTRLRLIVEDSGLFIDALNHFPGPYSKYVYQTIGSEGILKLLKGRKNRTASFKSVIAFFDSNNIKCFSGITKGRISEDIRGKFGFGFDPIFEPCGNTGRTYGEMTMQEKNGISHRERSFRRFAEWYETKFLEDHLS